MNLPNKLTVLRMGLIPVFLVFMMAPKIPYNYLWAAIIFGAASFTDYLDGHIARKRNLVTDFGKFMDPLADKLLVVSALLCFVEEKWAPALVVIVILAREFIVTSVRLLAAGHGVVIAADIWGKIKTVMQIIWVLYALLLRQWYAMAAHTPHPVFSYVHIALMCIVLISTVLSGFHYVWNNRSLFADAK